MPDMLVKLYNLLSLEPELAAQEAKGIVIRRALPAEKGFVATWVSSQFNAHWHSECEVAFGYLPPTCWIATEAQQIVGFACYDTTAKGFFGPTGVNESMRGRGVGKALLLVCLHAMRWNGYGYAIIGGAGPVDFYRKAVNATVIEDSEPGLYKDMLRE
jgi:GNAT superfamily N-acetyltransferase